jgi:hypothetical protein
MPTVSVGIVAMADLTSRPRRARRVRTPNRARPAPCPATINNIIKVLSLRLNVGPNVAEAVREPGKQPTSLA